MLASIATVSLSGSLGEKLDAIAAAGFDALELFENDLVTFSGPPTYVRKAADDLGLAIVTLQPFRDFGCSLVQSASSTYCRNSDAIC